MKTMATLTTKKRNRFRNPATFIAHKKSKSKHY